MKGERWEKQRGSPSVRRAASNKNWTLGLFSLFTQTPASCSIQSTRSIFNDCCTVAIAAFPSPTDLLKA